MRLPIVLDCTGDLYVANSVEEAESAMEPIDVTNNEYSAYDREGRLLQPEVVVRGSRERSHLTEAETVPSHAEELKAKIIRYLARVGELDGVKIDVRHLEYEPLDRLIQRLANIAPV